MNLRKLTLSLMAVSFLTFGSAAHAVPPSDDLVPTGLSCTATVATIYDACSGAWEGNNSGNPNRLDKVNDEIFNAFGFTVGSFFDISADGPNEGTLNFAPVSGPFVIALKAGNAFSLYYEDNAGGPVSSFVYDTLGVQVNKNGIGAGLSHATIYLPVPEPETYAMLLVGLGLIGFSLRHKRI